MSGLSKLAAYRATLTQADKDALLVLARQTAQRNRELRDANAHLIKTEYLDSYYWSTLASKYKVRMPHANEPTSVKMVRRYLKRCNVPVESFNEHYTNATYFVKNNPEWSAYATAGIVLEIRDGL